MGGQEREYAEAADVDAAIRSLSDADYNRLQDIAEARLGGEVLGMDGPAVLLEALRRTLRGTRRWPKDVPFVAFVAGTIRSIVSELRDKAKVREDELDRSGEDESGNVRPDSEAVEPGSNPEEVLLGKEEDQRTKELEDAILAIDFGNDHAADVVAGLILGLEPEEIRDELKLDAQQYASARRAISRRRKKILEVLGRGSTT